MSSLVTDLRLVVVLVVAAALALLVPDVPWQVEWVFGLPLLVLLPGYALVAALMPERPGASVDRASAPGWPARFGLSLVGSAAVVAVVGVLLASQDRIGLTLASAVLSIGAVTLLAVGIAGFRRRPLQRDRRADPVAGASLGSTTGGLGTSGVQTIVLVVSVVLLVSTLAVAGTSPPQDPYSEVYLTEGAGVDVGPANGTQELVVGADNTVSLTLENHEGDSTEYRVVVRLQRVDSGTVVESERLDDFRVSLAAGETGVHERTLAPTMTGEGLRLQVLVYKGGTDGEIGVDSADLVLRLWVDATDEGST
jgi:uncharacterized membrane protein